MTTTLLAAAAQLANPELLARVKRLAARERDATAALVAHLAELDARRLYLAEGCASLFTYCTQVLRLSEHAACGRIEAARPRGSRRTTPRSRHVPAAVRRAVWRRDGGRCAFVSREGRRCTERGWLEFHHVRPYAAGGEATVGTIQLRCRAHDGYEAERWFGPGPWVAREPGGSYSVRTEFWAGPLGGAGRVGESGPSHAPTRMGKGRSVLLSGRGLAEPCAWLDPAGSMRGTITQRWLRWPHGRQHAWIVQAA